jgi:hypothetical protein
VRQVVRGSRLGRDKDGRMKVVLLVAGLLLAACGKVPAVETEPDAGPPIDKNPSGLRLDDGRIVSGTVDDGFELGGWSCAGTTCVQGGIK